MNESEKSKIIIDEDWKAQVEAEKEAARAAATSTPAAASTPEAASSAEAAPKREKSDPTDGPLPPATFPFLLTTIATQAMIALGQVPNPITGKMEVRPAQAKHYIDTLAMLEEKTTGNRTPDETAMLTEILHQLRMGYVMSMQNSK